MIIELSFVIVGGINFGLESQWRIVEDLIKKYPKASWIKKVNMKKGVGKYVVNID
tara:strand:+ start:114 stop:278 length:165 start_codon:yes stop_codon:yes gene_type:complete